MYSNGGSMKEKNTALLMIVVVALAVTGEVVLTQAALAQSTEAQAATAKRIGTIKAINGNALTLTPTSGSEVSVTLQPTARILRLAPGDKDLKNATPLQAQDLHVGDMIRVRGSGSADGNSIAALEVIVITQAAVAAVTDQIRQDWQKRGLGGLVESVDAAAGTVTLSIPSLTAKKTVVVRTTKDTVVHRYAPDSAKPEDAKPSSLAEIHPGDQLRARGNKNSGRHRNIGGRDLCGSVSTIRSDGEVGRRQLGNAQRSGPGQQEDRAGEDQRRFAAS